MRAGGDKKKPPATAYFPHPVARAVSSALRRFTSVFGMGTGGATSLWSPGALTYEVVRARAAGCSAAPAFCRVVAGVGLEPTTSGL